MVRGTRYLLGAEADQFRRVTDTILNFLKESWGYQEFVPSLLAPRDLFAEHVGEQVKGQMYEFQDRGNPPRDLCLIPEVTAIIRDLYKRDWSKSMSKPVKVCYLSRCYRYERPQRGRYREFWQLGVEFLGDDYLISSAYPMDVMLEHCLVRAGLGRGCFRTCFSVKRGLGYYVEDGFEIECDRLGAQKQIAGGGRYDCGIGWAIGVDRLLLALEKPGEQDSPEGEGMDSDACLDDVRQSHI